MTADVEKSNFYKDLNMLIDCEFSSKISNEINH